MSKNTSWFVLCATVCCLLWSSILLTACGSQAPEVRGKNTPHTIARDNIEEKHATPTPDTPLQAQATTPTPTPTQKPAGAAGGPTNIPATGSGAAPYGSPPGLTALEQQLTQQLFNQINSDRAARGLYAYQWNTTLAGGARLHSWNMFHCGFSHTCPDGLDQCQRIANEGFAGYSDCGENIGEAGPSSPPWTNVYAVHMSMVNEPPTGWHRIHLFSTTLHRIGIGVYVDPSGWVWFTEDMVS
ncbi:CAP domain-containing protein [Ktedonobacter racemifer]|uniref:SCP-like extracellular n=1 Tax=Ktedonobacter racemifer DSM 44963 TaxID=485913 RepID=D6TNW1_KTERA|nr:CAP domain-containing protein [Ktedonobacter racemifer]EFH85497.1 SCP-like extracellular [Ktedonobacter racemifer DSM 44963]